MTKATLTTATYAARAKCHSPFFALASKASRGENADRHQSGTLAFGRAERVLSRGDKSHQSLVHNEFQEIPAQRIDWRGGILWVKPEAFKEPLEMGKIGEGETNHAPERRIRRTGTTEVVIWGVPDEILWKGA